MKLERKKVLLGFEMKVMKARHNYMSSSELLLSKNIKHCVPFDGHLTHLSVFMVYKGYNPVLGGLTHTKQTNKHTHIKHADRSGRESHVTSN